MTLADPAGHEAPIEPRGQGPGPSSDNGLGVGPLTVVLIALSVAVAIFSQLGKNASILDGLFISSDDTAQRTLPEIFHGQVWRLITPIFIHFSLLHILFNMLWLKDLGTLIEKRASSGVLLALVAVIGVCSNVGQFYTTGPNFGGMSGVVYGLLGYVWMKSKFDPRSGFYVANQTVTMMIVWFFLCLANVIGHVANTAHGVGLGIGIAWGFLAAKTRTAGEPE